MSTEPAARLPDNDRQTIDPFRSGRLYVEINLPQSGVRLCIERQLDLVVWCDTLIPRKSLIKFLSEEIAAAMVDAIVNHPSSLRRQMKIPPL